jgi:1-acyl-sn-glycerol-3-phosphate acyltransferase
MGIGFKFAVNFVGSDSLFRSKLMRGIMNWAGRPIPIAKGSSDPAAIKGVMSVIRDGGAVGIFPEGNRTFFGETGYFKPTIGKLAKKLGVPLVIMQIRGGFNTAPRWRKSVTRGKMTASVTRVLVPEEMEKMTDGEINDIIRADLQFNEFAYNAEKKYVFRGKKKAENLESVLFACPHCKSMTDLHSEGDEFFCGNCNARVRLNPLGVFEKVNNADGFPETILDWSKIQLDTLKFADFDKYTDAPVFSDGGVKIYLCQKAKRQEFLETAAIGFYADRFEAGSLTLPFSEITDMSVQDIDKLQIYTADKTMYMLKFPYKSNCIKYMICAYRVKNIKESRGGEDFYGY